MTNPKIIIVTGANRGIGQAICNLIIQRPGIVPLKLFATSRTGDDLGLNSGGDSGRQVRYPRLDIYSHDSIKAFAGEVKQHGAVDVLINNAGVNLDAQYGYDNARKTLDVNYRGTLEMCKTFLPLLSPHGRIVNLSSIGSSLKQYDETIQSRFRSASTLDELDKLADEFLSSVQTHTEEKAGFGPPERSYSVSKALVNGFTQIFAKSTSGQQTINCCCPGWIATEMGRLVGSGKIQPPKTPEEGARVPLHLALDDLGGVNGRYWANDTIRSKDEGKVQEW